MSKCAVLNGRFRALLPVLGVLFSFHLVLLTASESGLAAQQQGAAFETVLPGGDEVEGSRIEESSASWANLSNQNGEWVAGAVISEELTVSDDGKRLIRVQTTDRGAWSTSVYVEFDRASLRPIVLRRTLGANTPSQVTDRLAPRGFMKEVEVRFDGTKYEVETTAFDGEVSTKSGDLGVEFFDASVLGLVLAAQTLDADAGVRLPVLFVDGLAGAVTPYWIEAKVKGSESLSGIDALQVDVGWAEFDSGIVSSPGGADKAGGAYWLARTPTSAVPHVLRYKNESVDIFFCESGAELGKECS